MAVGHRKRSVYCAAFISFKKQFRSPAGQNHSPQIDSNAGHLVAESLIPVQSHVCTSFILHLSASCSIRNSEKDVCMGGREREEEEDQNTPYVNDTMGDVYPSVKTARLFSKKALDGFHCRQHGIKRRFLIPPLSYNALCLPSIIVLLAIKFPANEYLDEDFSREVANMVIPKASFRNSIHSRSICDYCRGRCVWSAVPFIFTTL